MICIGNQTACWAATPREPFDYAVANGFDAFEWFPDKKPGGGWDEGDLAVNQRRIIQDIARAHGMRLSVHARWQVNPLQPDAATLLERDIELARDLGAQLLNIHLFQEQGISAYVAAIEPLIRQTTAANLQLAIENTPSHTPEDFNELFAQLRRRHSDCQQHIGMCLDLGHANLCSATRNHYLQFIDRLDPSVPIIHLHLHENYGDTDAHLPLFTGPAGQNDAGIRGLLIRLRQRRFSGSMILEQWPHPASLLNQARNKLIQLLDETIPYPQAKAIVSTDPAATLDDFTRQLIAGNQRCRSWREKLDFIRELIASEAVSLSTEQLVDIAVYLRFLGTGEIPCVEDGRHFRPAHHARIALQIQERLAKLSTPETAFIIRKIYPWLPSSSREFQRAEPLTRIRDIAHRNDIPAELKQEIKHSLQNKLHRCAGPEDLTTSAALLERITAHETSYPAAFIEQFRIFHDELKEFFNARSLDERLQSLLPAVSNKDARLIHKFLAEKSGATLAGQIAAFNSLTELRRCLISEANRVPGLEKQEFLLADIGLEDFAFALLSEIVNGFDTDGSAAEWTVQLEVLQQTIKNLEMSHVEPEESRVIDFELQAWRTPFNPTDREHLLRLKATVGRARRLADNYSDRIMAWFPQRAQALGQALAVPHTALQVFGDAEIRYHLIFQLSKLVSSLLRRFREELALPAWDVVVIGHAIGRIKLAKQLETRFSEPTLVLLEYAEGDEEIPAGVTGIVLAHELPHLSHLGVRARQAGVVLVACEESSTFQALQRHEGRIVLLTATAERVDWQTTESTSTAVSHAPKIQIPHILDTSAHAWLPLEQALPERAGNKADGVRRLAALSQQPAARFKTPAALVIPFGVLEQALRGSGPSETEYHQILNHLTTGSFELTAATKRLRELVQKLNVPPEISAGISAQFARHTRLMVRSSANDEDLARLAGAGLYESVANVMPADVALAVSTVWASLWTKRAVSSRQQAGISQFHAHMAVLIQHMLVPDFSFILHTVNPINQDPQEAYAEIAVGLGETLASGNTRGNPYRLICNKTTGAVTTLAFANFSEAVWPNPAGGLMRKIPDYSRVTLSLERATREELGRRLAAIARLVETAFQSPQDIEGVVKGEEIYLVQARPQQGLEVRK